MFALQFHCYHLAHGAHSIISPQPKHEQSAVSSRLCSVVENLVLVLRPQRRKKKCLNKQPDIWTYAFSSFLIIGRDYQPSLFGCLARGRRQERPQLSINVRSREKPHHTPGSVQRNKKSAYQRLWWLLTCFVLKPLPENSKLVLRGDCFSWCDAQTL